MKKQALLFAFVMILGSLVAFSTGALAPDPLAAAPGGVQGPPDGKGGGGGAPDYGDLIILYRDANGVPIPSEEALVPDPETGDLVDGGLCWQPIAFDPDNCGADAIPLDTISGEYLVPVDQYNCGVDPAYAACTREVDFGRINEARSPEDVFLSQLEDVVTKLAIADSTSLDPAGRMVASTCPDEEEVTTSAIDSPLQNLAIYRQLLLTGTIGTDLPDGAGILDTAARGLGAASDKSGGVNLDMVAYLNQIMGLTVIDDPDTGNDEETDTILSKLCETYREEVRGVIQLVQKCFLDYGDYEYNRGANFGALPNPAYIPEGNPAAGSFEYLGDDPSNPGSYMIVQEPILDAVFGTAPGNTGGNIGGFAQAADDTRAVIEFMHDNPLPAGDTTPVPCIPSEGTFVDVSISNVSGFQVPKNVVDGSSDREFIVNVANAGPDDATVTLTVTYELEVGGTVGVEADLGHGFIEQPFVFPVEVIQAGGNHAFSALISVEIGQRTTITWEAVAESEEDDVHLGNNTATAVSNVKVTGGGGGGRPPR